MKNAKRISAMLLAVVMLFSLVACRQTEDPQDTDPSAPVTQPSGQDEVTEPENTTESDNSAEPSVVGTLELVNYRGDIVSVNYYDNGEYRDDNGALYTYDGAETWTDELGTEWNRTLAHVEDSLKLVNLRGDLLTVHLMSNGEYRDDSNMLYTFDGVDTWTDEQGVQWNVAQEYPRYPGDGWDMVNLQGDVKTVYQMENGEYRDSDGVLYTYDGVDTWTDEGGAEWNLLPTE